MTRLCRKSGAEICSTEMIDAAGYARSEKYRALFPFYPEDQPLVVQVRTRPSANPPCQKVPNDGWNALRSWAARTPATSRRQLASQRHFALLYDPRTIGTHWAHWFARIAAVMSQHIAAG
jgi:hypothetical protein